MGIPHLFSLNYDLPSVFSLLSLVCSWSCHQGQLGITCGLTSLVCISGLVSGCEISITRIGCVICEIMWFFGVGQGDILMQKGIITYASPQMKVNKNNSYTK